MDSSALLAYLNGEAGGEIVSQLLQDQNNLCYVHTLNLCEVYYVILRRHGKRVAEYGLERLKGAGVIEREDMDRVFWQCAATLKAKGGISLMDCFCVALAQRLDAKAVTTDHTEFDPIVQREQVSIVFLR